MQFLVKGGEHLLICSFAHLFSKLVFGAVLGRKGTREKVQVRALVIEMTNTEKALKLLHS